METDPSAAECMDALMEADECIGMFDKSDEQELRSPKGKVLTKAAMKETLFSSTPLKQ